MKTFESSTSNPFPIARAVQGFCAWLFRPKFNYEFNPDYELRSVTMFAVQFYYRVLDKDPKKRAERVRLHEAALRTSQAVF